MEDHNSAAMTVEALLARKRALESEVQHSLKRFVDETGVLIRNLDIGEIHRPLGRPPSQLFAVRVTLDV